MDPTFLLFVLTVEEVVRRKGALTIFFFDYRERELGNHCFFSFLLDFFRLKQHFKIPLYFLFQLGWFLI